MIELITFQGKPLVLDVSQEVLELPDGAGICQLTGRIVRGLPTDLEVGDTLLFDHPRLRGFFRLLNEKGRIRSEGDYNWAGAKECESFTCPHCGGTFVRENTSPFEGGDCPTPLTVPPT